MNQNQKNLNYQNQNQIQPKTQCDSNEGARNKSQIQLRKLSNEALDESLKSLVRKEREVLSEILYHLAEIDRRRLYLKMAYSSLFEYLTKHLGYSAGSAQRRIDAARLLPSVPDLVEKLENGSLNLAQVSLLQKAIREKKKQIRKAGIETATHNHMSQNQIQISKEQKQELIQNLHGKSFEESQRLVAQTFDLEIKAHPKVSHQRDESIRLEVTLSKEQWQNLQQMRELLSASLPNGSGWGEVLEYVAEKVIQQKSKTRSIKTANKNEAAKTTEPQKIAELKETEAKKENALLSMRRNAVSRGSRQIPAAVKRFIFQRDQCCQYKDPHTQKQCTSTWQLQIDHIHPVWDGGSNDLENPRLLCAAHNQYRYKQQARIQ